MKRIFLTAFSILLITGILVLIYFGLLYISELLKEKKIIIDYRVIIIINVFVLVIFIIDIIGDCKYEFENINRHFRETEKYLNCYIEKFNRLVDVNYSVETDINQSMFYQEEYIKKIEPSCIQNFAAEFCYFEKELCNKFTIMYSYVNFKSKKKLEKIVSRFLDVSITGSHILDMYSKNKNIIFDIGNELFIDVLNEERKILHEYVKEIKIKKCV